LTANDLVAWAKLIGFADQPEIARCEIPTFRYRVLHVTARITRSARQLRLRIDATWRWSTTITNAWHPFAPPSPDAQIDLSQQPRKSQGPGKPAHPGDTGPVKHATSRKD
jgi:hypothetical protein